MNEKKITSKYEQQQSCHLVMIHTQLLAHNACNNTKLFDGGASKTMFPPIKCCFHHDPDLSTSKFNAFICVP